MTTLNIVIKKNVNIIFSFYLSALLEINNYGFKLIQASVRNQQQKLFNSHLNLLKLKDHTELVLRKNLVQKKILKFN